MLPFFRPQEEQLITFRIIDNNPEEFSDFYVNCGIIVDGAHRIQFHGWLLSSAPYIVWTFKYTSKTFKYDERKCHLSMNEFPVCLTGTYQAPLSADMMSHMLRCEMPASPLVEEILNLRPIILTRISLILEKCKDCGEAL